MIFLPSPAPFLCHPNLWIRYGAVGFITVVAQHLNIADVYCKLMPYLHPFITQPIIQVRFHYMCIFHPFGITGCMRLECDSAPLLAWSLRAVSHSVSWSSPSQVILLHAVKMYIPWRCHRPELACLYPMSLASYKGIGKSQHSAPSECPCRNENDTPL